MTNKELQALLATMPDELPVKLRCGRLFVKCIDFTDENIALTSTTAFPNDESPEDEWDNESGKIELGSGEQYLLINPPIH